MKPVQWKIGCRQRSDQKEPHVKSIFCRRLICPCTGFIEEEGIKNNSKRKHQHRAQSAFHYIGRSIESSDYDR